MGTSDARRDGDLPPAVWFGVNRISITWVILERMKTAISIPDPIFEAADRLARRLGVPRSELYAKAVSAYLERYRQEGVTAALNRVYGSNPEESRVEADVRALQEASVPRERW